MALKKIVTPVMFTLEIIENFYCDFFFFLW